ncbi:PQQ-binding-like beta-propeller repeat protein (plasmid) [Streptomyces sp. NBC_00390]|uniref:outer membrane protein assembly factor BamB family protein n=1 Tax=Streptomyces sp. NBC_00390 TaxID=2975736 RepID=UPI002E1C6DBC
MNKDLPPEIRRWLTTWRAVVLEPLRTLGGDSWSIQRMADELERRVGGPGRAGTDGRQRDVSGVTKTTLQKEMAGDRMPTRDVVQHLLDIAAENLPEPPPAQRRQELWDSYYTALEVKLPVLVSLYEAIDARDAAVRAAAAAQLQGARLSADLEQRKRREQQLRTVLGYTLEELGRSERVARLRHVEAQRAREEVRGLAGQVHALESERASLDRQLAGLSQEVQQLRVQGEGAERAGQIRESELLAEMEELRVLLAAVTRAKQQAEKEAQIGGGVSLHALPGPSAEERIEELERRHEIAMQAVKHLSEQLRDTARQLRQARAEVIRRDGVLARLVEDHATQHGTSVLAEADEVLTSALEQVSRELQARSLPTAIAPTPESIPSTSSALSPQIDRSTPATGGPRPETAAEADRDRPKTPSSVPPSPAPDTNKADAADQPADPALPAHGHPSRPHHVISRRRALLGLTGTTLVAATALATRKILDNGSSEAGPPREPGGKISSSTTPSPSRMPGEEIWSFLTNSLVSSSPAVANGVVYVGSWDRWLYAVDTDTERESWSFRTGYFVSSSPVVVDGVVYVGSDDGKLYAVGADSGKQRWSFPTGDAVRSSPVVVDGVVYVGSNDGKLYAVGADTGKQRWSFPTGGAVRSSPVVVDGVVYVGSNDGKLYAVGADSGKQRWSFPTGGAVRSSPAVVDGVVYVGSNDGKLYAVGADSGKQRWSFPTGIWVFSSPAVVDGVVYVGSDDGKLYAVGADTGKQRWSFPTGDALESSPAVADGVVYVGSNVRKLYAVNADTGKKIWSFLTSYGDVTSSPTVADGVVYFGGDDGKLYAVQT